MSEIINIADAKAHFSEIIKRAEQGEEIIIGRGNKPVARLTPFERAERRPGQLKALLSAEQIEALLAAFDAPLSEGEQRALEGEETDAVGIWIGGQPDPKDKG
jgi:prevent-host-death family protein